MMADAGDPAGGCRGCAKIRQSEIVQQDGVKPIGEVDFQFLISSFRVSSAIKYSVVL